MKLMIGYSKITGITQDLNIDYTSAFRISLNHTWKNVRAYYGCPHSCWYCYVKPNDAGKFRYLPKEVFDKIPKFSKEMFVVKDHIKKIEEWIQKDIEKGSKNKDRYIHMFFCSDPFPYSKNNENQYLEIKENTLNIMKMVNGYGYKIEFISKGVFPVNEIIKIDKDKLNSYGVSIPTLDSYYCNKYEPLASPLDERIKAIKDLDNYGYNIWINIAPLFLGNLTDVGGKTIYTFQTGLKEIKDLLDGIKNLKHLRLETLRGRNKIKNVFTKEMKQEVRTFFNGVIENRGIKRYFLDLEDNIIDENMDANKKAKIYKDETRKKKQKIN